MQATKRRLAKLERAMARQGASELEVDRRAAAAERIRTQLAKTRTARRGGAK